MSPFDEIFLDFNGARTFFSKIFRYVKVYYVNYGPEIQIRAQLLTYIVYNKRDWAIYIMFSELNSRFLCLWPIVFVKIL